MAAKAKRTGSSLTRRLRFPAEEKRLPWLPLLLDGYAVIDTGIDVAIRREEKQRSQKIACRQGCDVCCRQSDIPVYPHELVGIYWYASEQLGSGIREVVKQQLAGRRPDSACPFLVNHACAIHPLRPASCRQFNVFTLPCAEGEDPYYSRRRDVLEPLEDYLDRAFAAVLTFYGVKDKADPARAVRTIRRRMLNLQSYDWTKLLAVMERPAAELSHQDVPR